MSGTPEADWLNLLIGLLQGAQLRLLRLLDALGLAGHVHGQPAWPWSHRLSGENLLIDLAQARSVAWTLVFGAAALLVLLLAALWRRPRAYLLAMVPMLLLAAPWPEAHVVLVPATPTSFQVSPAGFTAASIAHGRALYQQNCVACHGAGGRGDGPLAASLAVLPPDLAGPLLWRRADGDLLWRILHGTRDAQHGAATMPGFGAALDEGDAWALINYMKALGAGQSLRALGSWPQPIGLPDMAVRCGSQPPRTLASWRGQRVRVVAGSEAPAEDARLVTVLLVPPSSMAPGAAADCVAQSAAAWEALALIAGTDRLAGMQLIADRDGWLRVRGEPGKAGWSDDDLVCRSEPAPGRAGQGGAVPADGLGALIARMDAEPVRFVKGGFIR
jgi:mono/diheme cytochrome c family protein